MMNLFKKFYFELTERDKVADFKTTDIYSLVRFFEEENARFQRDYLKGSVVVTKFQNKQFTVPLYSERIYLPAPKGTDWVKTLSKFFTKKQLPYDVPELKKEVTKAEVTQNEPVVETPKVQEPVQNEKAESSWDDLDTVPVAEPKAEPVVETPKVQEPVQNEKVESSWDDLDTVPVVEPKVDTPIKDEEMPQIVVPVVEAPAPKPQFTMSEIISQHRESPSVSTVEDYYSENNFNDETVSDFLDEFNQSIRKTLGSFLESENKKISAEVEALDHRQEIPQKVKEKYEHEQVLAERVAIEKNEMELASLIQAEQLRHEQEILSIKQRMANAQAESLNQINDDYKVKIEQEIQYRVTKETKHLENILEGKKSELAMRKSVLTRGLNESLKRGLSDVVENQDKMIEHLEEQKSSSSVLSLKSFRKAI